MGKGAGENSFTIESHGTCQLCLGVAGAVTMLIGATRSKDPCGTASVMRLEACVFLTVTQKSVRIEVFDLHHLLALLTSGSTCKKV